MKNIYFKFGILISFLLSGSVFGQIVITETDLPKAGGNYIVANDTINSIQIGIPSQTPQTWDFTSLVNNYYKAVAYENSAQTPYANDFPTSNINTYGPSWWFGSLYGGAPVDQNQYGYMYWSSDQNGFRIVGWRATTGQFVNDNVYEQPMELLIGVPSTYGSQFNNSSRWELPMDKVPTDVDTFYVTNRTKTLEVDAYGDITTAYGTFQVVRIHEYVTQVDSAIAKMNGSVVYSLLFAKDTTHNYMYMAKNIGYPVAIVHADKNNNVKDVEYLMDTTCTVWTLIKGQVTDQTGAPVANADVKLLIPTPDSTQMLVYANAITNSTGDFEIDHVQNGYYTMMVSSQGAVPTYLGDVTSWQDAVTFYSTCEDTMYKYITITTLPQMLGTGYCSGFITQTGSFKASIPGSIILGDPVPGVDVSIEQVPGGIVGNTQTDALGFYEFNNLYVDSTYRILVEIPGLDMDSTYTFTVTSNNTDHNDLNYVVDTTEGSGYITINPGPPLGLDGLMPISQISMFPNPANNSIYVRVNTEYNKLVYVMYNLAGAKVIETDLSRNIANQISLNNVSSGLYHYAIFVDGKRVHGGKLVVGK